MAPSKIGCRAADTSTRLAQLYGWVGEWAGGGAAEAAEEGR